MILRNAPGIVRHARLAREVGASWDEVLGSIMLTSPGFGLLPAVEAIPHARQGFDAARDFDPDTEMPEPRCPNRDARNRDGG